MTSSSSTPRLVLCEPGETSIAGLESFSPFCLKVHRGLKVLGLPYERRHGLPASFKKYNPTGQVPVLLIGGREGGQEGGQEVVSDSTAILVRIQALAGRTFHGTRDARLEGEAVLWEELADTALSGFLVASRWADERNWPGFRQRALGVIPRPLRGLIGARVRRRIMKGLVARDIWRAGPEACWKRFESLLDALEARAPEDGFWLGPLSSADLALFSQLFSLRQDLTPWQSERIRARPRLSRYLDRVDAATRAG